MYRLNSLNNIPIPTIISGCVSDYMSSNGGVAESKEDCSKNMLGYKCVLNSKATEDSMVCVMSD